MSTPEHYDQLARNARAKASRLRELEQAIRRTSNPLDQAFAEVNRRHTPEVWLSAAAERSRHALGLDRARADEAKQLCDAMADRLRSEAVNQDYVGRRNEVEANAARRRAEKEQGS